MNDNLDDDDMSGWRYGNEPGQPSEVAFAVTNCNDIARALSSSDRDVNTFKSLMDQWDDKNMAMPRNIFEGGLKNKCDPRDTSGWERGLSSLMADADFRICKANANKILFPYSTAGIGQ